MGYVRHGDEDLHYSDGSHRWIPPADIDQEVWDAVMRAHQAAHLGNLSGNPHETESHHYRRLRNYRPPQEPKKGTNPPNEDDDG